MKNQLSSVLSNQLNSRRKYEILAFRAAAPDRVAAHVRPTHDVAGFPDGGVESAFTNLGVCTTCGRTRDDAVELADGGVCKASRMKLGLPVGDLDASVDPLDTVFE